MTADEALEIVANEVTRAALQEVIDNGLWDTYIDAELTESQRAALRDRLTARSAAGPDRWTLASALKMLV